MLSGTVLSGIILPRHRLAAARMQAADRSEVVILLIKWWSALFWGVIFTALGLRLMRPGPLWRRSLGVLIGIAGLALSGVAVWGRFVSR